MAVKQKNAGLFKSKTLRVTEVDFAGRPVYGPDTAIVTNGQVSVAYTANIEEGEALSSTNGNGDVCWTEPSDPNFTGYGIEALFCNVDFALFTKLTGHPLVFNDDGTIVGIEELSGIKLSNVNFALEQWTGANSSTPAREGAQGEWGYILTPFVRGGTITDVTVENAALTFGVTGMQTKKGSQWGKGPYAVDLVGGVPSVLNEAFRTTAYRRIMTIEIAPPEAVEGPIALLDPTDPALTSVTATVAGASVTFAPVPAGTDAVEYDFGNGEYDYAETGTYTYAYPEPGTYEYTARRGTSKVTGTVTVTA